MIHCYLNRYLFFVILFFLSLTNISAQDDCATTLSKAQKQFDAGIIEQIPQMLQPCIDNGFNKEEKMQAQKLIILAYLFDNNKVESDKAMLAFLKKYPEYEIAPSDQAEFIQLFKTYRTLPIASFGLIFGTNWSIIKASNLYGSNGKIGTYTNGGFNLDVGITYKQFIAGKFYLNLEAMYSSNSYKYSNTEQAASSNNSLKETQTRFEIPLSLLYETYSFGKFNTYTRGGINTSYTLSSLAPATRYSLSLGKELTGTDVTLTPYRNQLIFMPFLGAGINVHLKGLEFNLDVRYNMSFKNQVKDEKSRLTRKDTDDDLFWIYYIEDNDFTWNNFMISTSVFYRFYKPQKRTQR